eukprot:CAMPEP_0198288048 /NCGR_PEP_ID=MMETSP1449-20131203/6688_1 /TAXON_ID=420275 /ORGANISM="Attheya septentrionalis, Strain CCMP2084" /LENGTH=44 /DNA_ID= /DNA_START= /DNA_END= /DNA_ORIENTATION=
MSNMQNNVVAITGVLLVWALWVDGTVGFSIIVPPSSSSSSSSSL